ncbi:MAG: FtsW/RodA/SpoVE family cell cycle protein [Neofamilia sp.]
MINKVTKLRKPRNLLLMFDILAIGMLMLYKDPSSNRNMGILASALIILLYVSNIILERVTSGDNYIFMIVSMLVSVGSIINFSIDQVLGIKHLTWALVSIGGFYSTYFLVRYLNIWDKLLTPYILISVALFLATLFLGKTKWGATNWIELPGQMSVQPAEFIKLILVFIIACFYYNKSYFEGIKYSSIIMTGIVYLFIGFLFLQRDLGMAVMFLAIFMGLQFIYEENRKLILFSILLTILAVTISYFLFSHVKERFDIWVDPWGHQKGHQILQSLFAISSGGFTGSGIGLGYPKLIPVVNSDFIFAAICEEMGILSGISVIMLFVLLIYRSFKIALVQRHPFYRILALGIGISFGIQTFLAIGGVTKFIPMTGITLPFVSYGGSSMVASFLSLGVLQVCSEELKHKPIESEPDYE